MKKIEKEKDLKLFKGVKDYLFDKNLLDENKY
jgi:hypothetical protein